MTPVFLVLIRLLLLQDYVRSLHAAVRADQPREDEIYALYQGSEEIAKE